jgi:hypothetical protein
VESFALVVVELIARDIACVAGHGETLQAALPSVIGRCALSPAPADGGRSRPCLTRPAPVGAGSLSTSAWSTPIGHCRALELWCLLAAPCALGGRLKSIESARPRRET